MIQNIDCFPSDYVCHLSACILIKTFLEGVTVLMQSFLMFLEASILVLDQLETQVRDKKKTYKQVIWEARNPSDF